MKTLLEVKTYNPADSISFGKELLSKLPKNINIIFLNGEIGAGKTTLVKGIAKYLNIKDDIISPTFGYKREYKGLVHYDLFLNKKMKSKEIESLISEDLEDNLVVIEWGKKIPKIKNSVIIDIKYISESERMIKIKINKE